MNAIQLKLEDDKGAFVIEESGERIAEMQIALREKNMIVFHTEVAEHLKGQGIAKKLLDEMVAYAREKQLKVVPLCAYVRAQFERHKDVYNDIWSQDWHH